MFEIDRDAVADRRLDLTQPPFRMVGVTDEVAWGQGCRSFSHLFNLVNFSAREFML